MLYDFLLSNRNDLIERCKNKVAHRDTSKPSSLRLDHGIPAFLDQLTQTLRAEHSGETPPGERLSGPSGGIPVASVMGNTAKQHGRDLLREGFTVDEVVHDYGDLCQAITEAALEAGVRIEVGEFRTLNRCLDNAIADSVKEFTYQTSLDVNEQLGSFAHEVRNLIHTATLALAALKTGKVALGGATGSVLDRSLQGVVALVTATTGFVKSGVESHDPRKLHSLLLLIEETESALMLQAEESQCEFFVSPVDPTLAIEVDREAWLGALRNLVLNAFKYTHPGSKVSVSAFACGERIRVDIEDHCGGLPEGFSLKMFQPYQQGSADRSGMGLGLAISRRNVERDGGQIRVRNNPGSGCVFTMDMPRRIMPAHPTGPTPLA